MQEVLFLFREQAAGKAGEVNSQPALIETQEECKNKRKRGEKALLMNLLICVLVFDAQPVIYSFLTYAFVIEPAVRKEHRNY